MPPLPSKKSCAIATLWMTVVLGVTAAADAARAQDDRRRISARDFERAPDARSEAARLAHVQRMRSIDMLQGMVPEQEGERRADMMLRLADLYFQEARYQLGEQAPSSDDGPARCAGDGGCEGAWTSWQRRSIRVYEQIVRQYPRYRRADEALYYLGMALHDLDQSVDAVEQFNRLVKQYPESSFVTDAYILIGEHHFDRNEAFLALRAFHRASRDADNPKAAFALYKLAWCHYNVGEYDAAIETMQRVAVLDPSRDGAVPGAMLLQDEAFTDLVRFYADAGDVEAARRFLVQHGREDLVRATLRRLAATYLEQGKYEQTVATYRRLITEDPQSPDNPAHQAEIVKATRRMGRHAVALEELERLRKTYGRGSAWARANASNPDAVHGAVDAIEKDLRAIAVDYHTEARRLGGHTRARETYALAEHAYRIYLDEFPDNAHAYDMEYAFAELLFKVRRFAEAYDRYMAVVARDPNGAHSRFCAESAIFAAEELVAADGGLEREAAAGRVADGAEPLPLTPNEQRLIDACAQFARLYPGTDKTRSAIYKSGYLLYSRYRFAEAAAQFNLVIQMDPRSVDAERAANLILDSFAIRGDLEELKKNAKFYHEQPGLGSPRFKAEVFNVYQRASFQRIGEAVRAGLDPVAAADAYLAFYEEFLDTADAEVLPTALHNAAVHYTSGARHAEAMRARHLLVDDPRFGPRSKHYYVSVEALAYGYERIAAFGRAATYYEEVFALYPAERARVARLDPKAAEAMVDRALDAIYSAAVFREAAGDLSEAIEDYGLFLAEARRSRPRDERARDVALRIAGLHEERGDLRQAGEAYYAFFTRAPPDTPYAYLTYATLRFGDLLTRQGQRDGAWATYRRAVAEYSAFIRAGGAPGEHTEHVAEMMFLLAQPELDDFLALRITAPRGSGRDAEDRALRAQLTRKRRELGRVEGLFKQIIATRSSRWSLAALVSMGRMQEDMIETLRSADVPRYLTEEQAAYYRGGLEDQAYQRKQAAIELYQLALGKAYELTLYNDDTAFARRRLADLAPDDFAGVEEALLPPHYVARRRSYGFEVEP